MFPNSLGGHGRSINLASSRQTMRRVPGVPGAGETDAYFKKILALFGSDIVGYWPMSEATGSVAVDYSGRGHNGAYTGVTLNQPGLGDGRGAPLFDGTTSFNNVYSSGLNTDFNNQEGTLAIWAKVANAGVWTDGVARYCANIGAGVANRLIVAKNTGNNTLDCYYIANSTASTVSNNSAKGVRWYHVAMTYSKSDDKVRLYIDGTQSGADVTGLGVWSGALASTTCVIGAQTITPTTVWSGLLAHALLLNRPATPAEVLTMATV